MKKMIIIILIIAALGGLYYLVANGIINWQPLTIAVAAIAGPFKYILSLFKNEEAEIHKRHREVRDTELEFQKDLETRIAERGKKIEVLKSEISVLDTKLDELEKKREQIAAGTEGKTVSERQQEGQDLFGD